MDHRKLTEKPQLYRQGGIDKEQTNKSAEQHKFTQIQSSDH